MITAPTGSQQFCSRATPGLARIPGVKFSYQLLPMGGRYTASSQPSLRLLQASREGWPKGTISLDATLTVGQNIGHNSLQGLATRISTGVTSGPTQLFCERLAQDIQASYWPAHLS